MTSVNSTYNLDVIVGNPFQPFNWTVHSRPVISLPQKDEVGKGCLQLILHFAHHILNALPAAVLEFTAICSIGLTGLVAPAWQSDFS